MAYKNKQDNKNWWKKNKEKAKKYHQDYFEKNKEKIYEYHKEWCDKNREKTRTYTKRWRENNKGIEKKQRLERKLKAIELFGGKCMICGFDECLAALDFHHEKEERNGKNENCIANLLRGTKWEKIEKELKKCILVCANCHRRIHWEQ
jgi:hypothetical protein